MYLLLFRYDYAFKYQKLTKRDIRAVSNTNSAKTEARLEETPSDEAKKQYLVTSKK